MIYFDGVIVVYLNEVEWNKFKLDYINEVILDRIVKIEVFYCLEFDEEVKIYEKILKKSIFKVYIVLYIIKIVVMFVIFLRLILFVKVDVMIKFKIYNGEEIVEKGIIKKIDIVEFREEVG